MRKVTIEDIEDDPHSMGVNPVRKPIASAIDDVGFAMTYVELAPGERFSGALHTHHDQEELFYVIKGTATWTVREDPDGEDEEITVGPGEVIHFAPGDVYQTGVNESDEPVVGVALGVPGARHDREEVEVIFGCPECGGETVHTIDRVDDRSAESDAGEWVVVCTDCGRER